MRIPFPERINLTYALIFAAVLGAVQIFEGTNPFFSACVFCFILVAAVGVNVAGGVKYPSGAFIFFNAFFTMVLPCTTKAILREPANSNLRAPLRTIEIYLLGMVMMLLAAIFARRFRARKSHIAGLFPVENLHTAYVGCAVLSIILTLYISFFASGGNGTLDSFLVQANRFPILTFLLGVMYTIHRTDGRRSVTWPLLLMILFISFGAVFTFSKEQFLSPFFAWAVAAALMGYRLKWINLVVFGLGCYFVVAYLVPYAQYGRGVADWQGSRGQLSAYLFTHMDDVREEYDQNSTIIGNVHFYDRHLGLLDRLELFSVDDALIDLTDREGTFGYSPMVLAFENVIPHAFWPNKPIVLFGNNYAHEIGILPDDNFGTGVSFSPSADAYHEGRMVGVFLVEPLTLMLVFIVLDSVIGNVRLNPVGLLTTMLVARAASEGALFGSVALIEQPLITNLVAVYVCAFVLPVLGSVFARKVLRKSPPPVVPVGAQPSVLPSVTPL